MSGEYTIPDFGPSDILTSKRINIRRVAVDSQQTSYEANEQFRYHIFFSDLWGADLPPIPSGQQLVLKFNAVNPVNIISRLPEVYLGGIVYRVFPDDENVNFTGTLVPSENIFNINGNLDTSGLSENPTSLVTVEYDTGVDIFRSTSKSPTGTIVVTDGSANHSTNAYSPNDLRAGVARNTSFWLVLDTLGNQECKGMLTISYEERFESV